MKDHSVLNIWSQNLYFWSGWRKALLLHGIQIVKCNERRHYSKEEGKDEELTGVLFVL